MDGQRFDQVARVVATATRRRLLRGLTAGAAVALGLPRSGEAAAGCGTVGAKCRRRRDCCAGMACKARRCRCKPASDTCGRRCCDDCFEFPNQSGTKTTEFCCPAAKICPEVVDEVVVDVCCYPDEVCLGTGCCCDGCLGETVCGGVCCPSASCCDGDCCEPGNICAQTTEDGPPECEPAARNCTTTDTEYCHFDETCHGGKCCSGNRVCARLNPETPGDACCPYGQYCDTSRGMANEQCCDVGELCATYRPTRVRR